MKLLRTSALCTSLMVMAGFALPVAAEAPHREADLVLTNANVITVDAHERLAHSVAVRDGHIVAVDDAQAWIGPHTRVLDLQGRTVLPGFIDSHTHVDGMADVEAHTVNIQVPPLAGPDAIIARLKELQKKLGPGAWLHGNGTYNQVMPTREQLDAAFPDNPVRLDWSVHDNVINHAAAVALKLDRNFPDPPAGSTGRLERTADGEVKIIRDYHVPFPVETFTHAEKRQALKDILEKFYLERGVTTVSDMAITGPDTFQAYQELRDEGQLPARVRMNPLFNKPGQAGGMLSTGWHTGLGDDMLSIGAIKFVLDGVWGTTAAVYKPFWNGSGTTWIANNRGGTSFTQEQLTSEVVAAHKAGWQVQIHANGDRAQDMALTAYEAAQAAAPRPDARDRIEHFGHFLVQDERTAQRLARMKADGVIPSMQPAFLWRLTNVNVKEPGVKFFALRTLIDAGMHPPGGVDTIGTQNFATYPLFSIQRAVVRDTKYGTIAQPEEAITVMEGIKMFTIWGAEANFMEKTRGSIEPGKLADFVVLDADPLKIAKTGLSQINVDMTILGGRVAYDRKQTAQ